MSCVPSRFFRDIQMPSVFVFLVRELVARGIYVTEAHIRKYIEESKFTIRDFDGVSDERIDVVCDGIAATFFALSDDHPDRQVHHEDFSVACWFIAQLFEPTVVSVINIKGECYPYLMGMVGKTCSEHPGIFIRIPSWEQIEAMRSPAPSVN